MSNDSTSSPNIQGSERIGSPATPAEPTLLPPPEPSKKTKEDPSQQQQSSPKPKKEKGKQQQNAQKQQTQQGKAAKPPKPPKGSKPQKPSSLAHSTSLTDLAQGRPSSASASTSQNRNISTPATLRFDDSKTRSKVQKNTSVQRKLAQKTVQLFSHLPQYEREANLVAEVKAKGLIHPAVLSLGLQFSEFVIAGGNARCTAMLLTFKKVVSDYITPSGTSLQRHLTQHISKQVDFLAQIRTLCASMKTAIRFLKSEISSFPIDIPDEDAKKHLCDAIDDFMSRRIDLAGDTIANTVLSKDSPKIRDGDVIMTFGRSSTVLKTLLKAHEQGIRFRVIVVDSRPKLEGKEMLKSLVEAEIKCTYVFTSALPYVIKNVTKCFLGASSVLSDGAILSRAGTAVVCMSAFDAKIPVIVLCEWYKFSEAVRLDSFVWNEIGDPDELVDVSNRAISQRLPFVIPPPYQTGNAGNDGTNASGNTGGNSKGGNSGKSQSSAASTGSKTASLSAHGITNAGALKTWRDIKDLKLLNLHYDVTPSKFVTMVVCELSVIPSTSVLTVLKDSSLQLHKLYQ